MPFLSHIIQTASQNRKELHYYIRLTAVFQDNLGKPAPEKQNHSGKTNLDLLEQEIVSGSGISLAICKSAPHPRQITMPASHHSVFTGWMPFLPPNQQRQSTEGKGKETWRIRLTNHQMTNRAMLRPRKKLAMSWSEDCHGKPRAFTTVSSSTGSLGILQYSYYTPAFNLSSLDIILDLEGSGRHRSPPNLFSSRRHCKLEVYNFLVFQQNHI